VFGEIAKDVFHLIIIVRVSYPVGYRTVATRLLVFPLIMDNKIGKCAYILEGSKTRSASMLLIDNSVHLGQFLLMDVVF
jgi:hypothetical protein